MASLGPCLPCLPRHGAEQSQAKLFFTQTPRARPQAFREYRHEYEAALVSHHLAVQEENRRALQLDVGLAVDGGMELLSGEDGGALAGEEEDATYLGALAQVSGS